MTKKKTTKIDYTLEQFLAESKRNERVISTLEKIVNAMERIASVQQKQQDLLILHSWDIKHLLMRIEKLEKRHGT
jgi:hypothetical protein